jgi:hypothetical protein
VRDHEPGSEYVSRLDAVLERLRELSALGDTGGLTEPDQPSGERWERGQVWAHLAEFIPYWLGQIEHIRTTESMERVPFGRTKTDPGRIAAIEHDRGVSPADLFARLEAQAADLRALLEEMTAEDWAREGEHPTLGTMSMSRVVEEFLVGHLEAHAAQLEGL